MNWDKSCDHCMCEETVWNMKPHSVCCMCGTRKVKTTYTVTWDETTNIATQEVPIRWETTTGKSPGTGCPFQVVRFDARALR